MAEELNLLAKLTRILWKVRVMVLLSLILLSTH